MKWHEMSQIYGKLLPKIVCFVRMVGWLNDNVKIPHDIHNVALIKDHMSVQEINNQANTSTTNVPQTKNKKNLNSNLFLEREREKERERDRKKTK